MDFDSFQTVDWVADDERLNKSRLTRTRTLVGSWAQFLAAAESWFVLAASGALVGAIAVVLTIATTWLADLREGHCHPSWYLNAKTCCLGEPEGECTAWREHPAYLGYLIYILLSVALAVSASFIVANVEPFAAGSGISEIKCITSGFRADQFLTLRTLVVKCIGLPLAIASGLSVGKEGPSVHYAACAGNVVSSYIPNGREFRKHSDLITACCGAGVAVAFGSPIGGVLFVLEEIAPEVTLTTVWRSYFCSLVATSVVTLMNPFRTGQLALFTVQYDGSWHRFELPFLVILGIFGGLVGQLIIRYNLRVTAMRKRFWGQYYVHEALYISLITAAICYFNSYLRMDMTKSMQILFHECEHGGQLHASCDPSNKAAIMLSLFVACALRLGLLLVSYGAGKVPAGIFVPSLAIGALFGRFVGTFAWLLYDRFRSSPYFSACVAEEASKCINPGTYALLGAGALLAGVMHITVTVVVVMFELTGALHYIVPTMVVVGITRLISSLVGEGGIADMAILANRLPFLEDVKDVNYHGKLPTDIMVPKSACVFVDDTDSDRAPSSRSIPVHYNYPVLDAQGYLLASIGYSGELDRSPITVRNEDNLEKVHLLFSQLGPHTIFVVEKGFFRGLITRKDLIRFHQTGPTTLTPLEEMLGRSVANFLEASEARDRRLVGWVRSIFNRSAVNPTP